MFSIAVTVILAVSVLQIHANPVDEKRELSTICPLKPCVLPPDCLKVVPNPDPCGCPICALDCSTVLCAAPDCDTPFPPCPGECCPRCPGSPCPPDKPLVYCFADPCEVTTCPAFPNAKCVSDFCGGCNARFFEGGKEVTENCLQGACPPTCSKDFCEAKGNEKALCNLPGPLDIPSCFGQCTITSCAACYYSKKTRPLPNCRRCGGPVDITEPRVLRCFKRWANCVHWKDLEAFGEPLPSCITDEKFKCYRYPCPLRG